MSREPLCWSVKVLSVAALALAAAGCGSRLRFAPSPQLRQSPVFADYRHTLSTVEILLDTGGRTLQEVHVRRADGTRIEPFAVHQPAVTRGNPHAPEGGPPRAMGPTTAIFDRKGMPRAPWHVWVTLDGLPAPLEIVVGP